MNTSTETQSTSTTLQTNVIGCVKWFNNRFGYGFIVATGEHSSYGDVFVHHSELQITDTNVYKFLMQGEYVQFNIVKTSTGKHEFQANHVTGVNGGKLMCEHPVQRRPSRRFAEEEEPSQELQPPRQQKQSRHQESPKEEKEDDGFVQKKPRRTSNKKETAPIPSSVPSPYKNALNKPKPTKNN